MRLHSYSKVFQLVSFLVMVAVPAFVSADLVSGLENYLQIMKGEENIESLSAQEAQEVLEIHERLKNFGMASEGCEPVIESEIDGTFNGWDGDTKFKLDNGQIWQQSSYDYTYEYDYRPEVLIYPSGGTCILMVEDVDETISVIRLK